MSLVPRRLLLPLAVALVLAVVATAGPVAAQGKYKESPALAEQVKAGKLPPVDQRLPENPLVVPVVERTGQYGGVWRRAFLGPADFNNYVRVVYDALARFSPDGAKIEPKIAAGWESSPDFKVWTIKLRNGARWSDGAPFTADDIVFWHKDVLLNKDLTSGTIVSLIKDPRFAIPTTIDDYKGFLYAVNARFGSPPATTDYQVVQVSKPAKAKKKKG